MLTPTQPPHPLVAARERAVKALGRTSVEVMEKQARKRGLPITVARYDRFIELELRGREIRRSTK